MNLKSMTNEELMNGITELLYGKIQRKILEIGEMPVPRILVLTKSA